MESKSINAIDVDMYFKTNQEKELKTYGLIILKESKLMHNYRKNIE
jgi:hypothetical protein